jgi:hypothetical protein
MKSVGGKIKDPMAYAISEFVDEQLDDYAEKHGIGVSGDEIEKEWSEQMQGLGQQQYDEALRRHELLLDGLEVALKNPVEGEEFYRRELSTFMSHQSWDSWRKEFPDVQSIAKHRTADPAGAFKQAKQEFARRVEPEIRRRKARFALAGGLTPSDLIVQALLRSEPRPADARTLKMQTADALERVAMAHTWLWISERIQLSDVRMTDSEFARAVNKQIADAAELIHSNRN